LLHQWGGSVTPSSSANLESFSIRHLTGGLGFHATKREPEPFFGECRREPLDPNGPLTCKPNP
jgi:hypothetical protein